MKSPGAAGEDEIRIKVKAIPRAKKNQISGFMEDGSLKVHLKAPPVDGKANQALIKLLADSLNVSQSAISIISGLNGRKKIVKIIGLSTKEYHKIIEQIAG